MAAAGPRRPPSSTQRQEAERNLAFAKKGNEILGSVFAGLDPKKNTPSRAELRRTCSGRTSMKAVKELEGSAIGDPLEVAAMQGTLGVSLVGLGEYDLAVEVLEKAGQRGRPGSAPTTPHTTQHLARGPACDRRWRKANGVRISSESSARDAECTCRFTRRCWPSRRPSSAPTTPTPCDHEQPGAGLPGRREAGRGPPLGGDAGPEEGQARPRPPRHPDTMKPGVGATRRAGKLDQASAAPRGDRWP